MAHQTAVEFLELCFIRNASISLDEWKTARKMIEQQIIAAYITDNKNYYPYIDRVKKAEQYYKEIYGEE
jgi:hypothetical protein